MQELSNIQIDSKRIIKCISRTLDDIVSESSPNKIDLIKIDVQGAEHFVITGATKTLQITSMIWIEVSFKPLYEGSLLFDDIVSMLNTEGFKLMELEPVYRSREGELLQSDALFLKL